MFLLLSFRLFFSLTGDAEQKSLKMKNGGHFKAAELKKPRPTQLDSVKKVGLGKQPQVSGDFCVKQKSFL